MTDLVNIIQLLPPMKSGQELAAALEVLPEPTNTKSAFKILMLSESELAETT